MTPKTTGTTRTDVLAIDPGANMGWAMLCSTGEVVSGHTFHPGKVDERLASFQTWLGHRLPAKCLVIERPIGIQGRANDSLFGMLGIARALAWEAGVSFLPVAPMSAKKAATGSGKAKKEDVLAWACERYGEVTSDDEADALAVLQYWLDRQR